MYDLRVPDSFSNPVPDETIEELLHENFKIWEFDWRKLDLSIDVIEVAAKDVKRLHLYTTGNWPVLFYWATSNIRRKLLEVCRPLNLNHSHDWLTISEARRTYSNIYRG